MLTSIAGYGAGPAGFGANTASNPSVVKQYCNGSKIPPEAGKTVWYQVPPGTNEGNVPVPIFNLTAGATVDEGNNWINISWGPLSLITPTTETNPTTETMLGNYSLAAGSPAINYITPANSGTTYTVAPADDFFGNARKTNNAVDAGAVEFAAIGGGGGGASASLAPTTRNFGTVARGSLLGPVQIFTLTNTGTTTLTGITQATLGGANPTEFTIIRLVSTCGPAVGGQLLGQTTLAPGASCVVSVQFRPLTSQTTGLKNATVSVTDAAGTQTSTLAGTANP